MRPDLREQVARPVGERLRALRQERRELTAQLRLVNRTISTLESVEDVLGIALEDSGQVIPIQRARIPEIEVPTFVRDGVARMPGDATG